MRYILGFSFAKQKNVIIFLSTKFPICTLSQFRFIMIYIQSTLAFLFCGIFFVCAKFTEVNELKEAVCVYLK